MSKAIPVRFYSAYKMRIGYSSMQWTEGLLELWIQARTP